jgi:CHAT domain-containing protein
MTIRDVSRRPRSSFLASVCVQINTSVYSIDKAQDRSYLALENDCGQTRRADIDDLRPHLQNATELRLVVLSGCQTAQTSAVDAFRGVATGLLQANLPAVLAMQFSILDQSGIVLARALYAALA